MTGSTAATSTGGTPISQTDRDRIEAEERLHEAWQRRTVCVVAGAARDADDCRLLLDILGLDAQVVVAAREEMGAAHSDKGRADAA